MISQDREIEMKIQRRTARSTVFVRYGIVVLMVILGTCLLSGICSVFTQGRWTSEVQAEEVGLLHVTITPQEAIDAGAQWRVDGGTWRDSGVSVGIQAGDHTVEFKDIDRWDAPADIPVTVVADEVTDATGTYALIRSLRVFITPKGATDAGAQWNVDGGPWQDSGTTVPDLSVGDHTVNYKEVFGWSAPPSETVTIVAGEITETTGTYTQLFGSLKATITPQTVISEGAQWKVDDGYWQDSGATISDLGVGEHTVYYKGVFGWSRPPDQTVNVYESQVTVTAGNYGKMTPGVTLLVPSEYPTIQGGINAASNGDTVLVADGTYVGLWNKALDFNGKAIKVASENGPENCIIDCERYGRGFNLHNDERQDSVISGFTIRGGYLFGYGGGIYCASPTIVNCIISDNCSAGDDMHPGGAGGGIYSTGSPIIMGCKISRNRVGGYHGSAGGGISCRSAVLSNCIINDNRAEFGMIGNSGGGIACSYSIIINCTISDNMVDPASLGGGGGISCGPFTRVTNTIVWNNAPDDILGSPIINYTDLKGGYPGEGNIDTDPMFADPENDDYRLKPGSPCIDTGTSEGAPDTDIDGTPRPQGAGFDMGAYEVKAFVYIAHDGLCDENTPCYSTIQEGFDWDGVMFTIKAEEGVFGEHIVMDQINKVFLQGGWDSEFTSPSGVTEVHSVTISDGTMVLDEGCLAIGVD
jgi:hypothetical protein